MSVYIFHSPLCVTEPKSSVYVIVETLCSLCLDKARGTESTSMAVRLEHSVFAEVKCFTLLLGKGVPKKWSFLTTYYTNLFIEWK